MLRHLSTSQALSSETSIDRLHARVVQVLSAMTGATGVHLLLWSEDRQAWLPLAPDSDGCTTPLSGPGHERAVPMSVSRYVQRTGEPLVVGDATGDDRFARDPYFTDAGCCSLLAVPILGRGMLRAVLVLENRLIRGAFSAGRLDAVQLIAGQTAGLVTDIVARRIGARFGLDPRRDVQVLCPMHRGPAGAGNLNLLLQEALTPYAEGQSERRYGGRVFRVGDKVTQLRNNYDKGAAGIFNGTVGMVTVMYMEDHTLTMRTDEDELVDYGFDELDELAHAYAVTIHRSQGSEYPAVVIPLTTSSWMMLQRNLLYTGVTRAKKLVVLAGSRRALAAAVRTNGAGRRHTALAHRLHQG